LKMVIFHSYVSLPEGKYIYILVTSIFDLNMCEGMLRNLNM
jgi:hypothetical protein